MTNPNRVRFARSSPAREGSPDVKTDIHCAGGNGTPPMEGVPIPLKKVVKEESKKDPVLDLLAGAASLTAEQKQELLARLTLQEQQPDDSRDVELWATAVHEALLDALGGAAGPGASPVYVRRHVGSREAFAPVMAFIRQAKIDQFRPNERLVIYRNLAKLLLQHAQRISRHTGAPLTAKLLATCARNLAAVFDAAFPGYLRSGLAIVAARRMVA